MKAARRVEYGHMAARPASARGPAKCASNYTALLLTNNSLVQIARFNFSYHIHYDTTVNSLLYTIIYHLNVNYSTQITLSVLLSGLKLILLFLPVFSTEYSEPGQADFKVLSLYKLY